MGRDKALLELSGKALIRYVLESFAGLFPEVIIVANDIPPFEPMGVPVVSDLTPGAGALGGLYTGLVYASCPHVFVAACDMPFISPAAVRLLLDRAVRFDVVLPSFPDGLHPLHAVYSGRCTRVIEKRIAAGSLRIIDFFPDVRVRQVTAEELAEADPEGRSVWNLNTPDDFRKAEALLEETD